MLYNETALSLWSAGVLLQVGGSAERASTYETRCCCFHIHFEQKYYFSCTLKLMKLSNLSGATGGSLYEYGINLLNF